MVSQSASARGKSETAFRTIGEVSLELDLPQHVLRFWESKFNRLRPMKRGGGRRYYRPEDIDLLKRIKKLLYEDGYTIKGVQKLMREGGTKIGDEPAPPPPAPAPAPVSGQLDDKTKSALKDVVTELQSLRDLLKKSQ